jgi:hypothetical protein
MQFARFRSRWGWLTACLVMPWLLLWPAPLVVATHPLSAPDQEAVQHLWGLWAAVEAGAPIHVTTDRIAWPIGFEFVLIDPANALIFGVGNAMAGPVFGYNLVLLLGVAIAGAAGALLTDVVGGTPRQRTVGAIAAMACPAVLSAAGEGITESFGVGWAGVALGALLLHTRTPSAKWGTIATASIAIAAWNGPYNALWAALLCIAVAATNPGAWRRWGPVGAGSVLLASTVVLAQALYRRDGLPGTPSRIAWEVPYAAPDGFRGGFKLGADLVDPFLPEMLTGGAVPAGHTAYLGVAMIALAVLAVARDRRRWPWLAGAAGLIALALGPWLMVWGSPVPVGDGYVAAPVGVSAQVFPGLLRITRWYRAAAVAGLLLAPLVAVSVPRLRGAGFAVSLLLLLDSCALAPRAWPVAHFDGRPSSVWAGMKRPGAVVELPPVQFWFIPEGGVRDANLLEQTWHGRATTASFFNLSGGAADSAEVRSLMALAVGRAPRLRDAPARLAGLGYAYVVVDRTRFEELDIGALEATLGRPVVRDERYLVFELPTDADPLRADFPPWASPVPPPAAPGAGDGEQLGPGGHRQ